MRVDGVAFDLARDGGRVTLLEVVEPFDDVEARRRRLQRDTEGSETFGGLGTARATGAAPVRRRRSSPDNDN